MLRQCHILHHVDIFAQQLVWTESLSNNTVYTDYMWEWFEDNKSGWKKTTLRNYRGAIKGHIVPRLGHIALCDLQRRHVKKWIKDMMKEGGRNGEGVSQSTVSGRLTVLSTALRDAVDDEMIKRNVAMGVPIPKTKEFKPIVIDDKMIKDILALAAGTRFYLPIYLAFYTGMRRGEILGLKWTVVYLDDGYLKVEWSRTTVLGRIVEDTPKTESSNRDVSLAEETVAYLREHRQHQEEVVFPSLGKKWSPEGYVFVNAKGEPINPEVLYGDFKEIVAKAGYPGLRFQDIRHAHATIMLNAKVNMKVIQERLGHKNLATTSDTYAHLLKVDIDEAAQVFEERMKQKPQ